MRSSENVTTVYILSDWKKNHRWTGPNRQHFLCGSLASLAGNLEALGGRLVIRQGDAVAELEKLALESDIAAKWLEGKAPSRVIVVPGKLVNLVP